MGRHALEMHFGTASQSVIAVTRQLTNRTVIKRVMAQVKTAQTLDAEVLAHLCAGATGTCAGTG
jgi:hypothetical protein